MGKIKKNLFVCIERQCKRMDSMSCCCPSPDPFVPDDCEYAIFHPLETDKVEIAQRGRRTGKTSTLVRVATMLAQRGCQVYYFTPTLQQGEHIKGRFPNELSNVKMCSAGQLRTGSLRGFRPGYIVTDDLTPSEQSDVERELIGSRVVAAYWT
jgi:hypothetical protein